MEHVGRYTLSVILAFLHENEGTSLLLTKKVYAHQFLPVFRCRSTTQDDNGSEDDDSKVTPKFRHAYIVLPVQDPNVLLARSNTRKLMKQRRYFRIEHALHEETKFTSSFQALPCGYDTTMLACTQWEWERNDLQHRHTQHAQQTHKNLLVKHSNPKEGCNHDQHDCEDNPPFRFPFPSSLRLLRFLDHRMHEDIAWRRHGITLLVSYPRSGNTLLRTLFERTTGYVTGSDTRPDRFLSRLLAESHDLVGEGITSTLRTPLVKSHWPERVGNLSFAAHRVVLLVRNPYDAMDSYWNLNVTRSHNSTVADEIYRRYRNKYHDMIRNEIRIWCQFHQFWLSPTSEASRLHFPVLIIRFEDLIRYPEQEMRRLLQFCVPPSLNTASSSTSLDSIWRERIRYATNGSLQSLGSYQPRMDKNGDRISELIGKSLSKPYRYTDSLLHDIHTTADSCTWTCNWLQFFGYDMITQNFPAHVDSYIPKQQHSVKCVSPSSILINDGNLIRPFDCPFGRAFTYWRQAITNNDTNPFPCADNLPQNQRGRNQQLLARESPELLRDPLTSEASP
jgi:hypothetical protein